MNLEKLIAENMVRFGVKNLTEVDREYLNSKILQEQIKPVAFSFDFPIGTYKMGEVGDVKIAELYNSLRTICMNISRPVLANIQTMIVLNASATKTGINVNSQLYKDGITNNTILAQKRLATLESLIRECIKNWIPSITDAEIDTNFKFKKSSSVGSTTAIAANITQTGEKMTNLLTCASGDVNFKGSQGSPANSYVGYEYSSLAAFGAGDTVTLSFDSVKIPDAFFIKMEGATEVVSGFRGDVTRGKDLSNNTKYPNLLAKINAKIKALGGTGTLSNVTVQKGKLQGGQDAFITFIKRPFLDKLKVVVFAPLDNTVFKINVSCKSGPKSDPLGPPKVASIQKKIDAKAAADAQTASAAADAANPDKSPQPIPPMVAAIIKAGNLTWKDAGGKIRYIATGKPFEIGQGYINMPKGTDVTDSVLFYVPK